ncbi:MAG: ABC transporter permease [Oceanipulchritudo sp.]
MSEASGTVHDNGEGTPLKLNRKAGGDLEVHVGADWDHVDPLPFLEEVISGIRESSRPGTLTFCFGESVSHDQRMVPFLLDIIRASHDQKLEADLESLPESVRKLLRIALAVDPHEPPGRSSSNPISEIGIKAFRAICESRGFIEFMGELVYTFGRFLTGKARFRQRDFWAILQSCGVEALPIVSLIAVMVGVILGFVGAVQLQKFGATIYMIDLVGLAMAREMGAVMTGVILSGRTGAAFAAQIGTMNVNQEIDALKTLGISAMEFLVLPRTIALVLMMPLLTLYANFLGWMGAFVVAIPMNISPTEFWIQLAEAVSLTNIALGIIKSFFFGMIVAASGCYYGLRSGHSSAAVGEATTRAVVAGITWIIIFDAVFAFTFEIIGV